MSQPSHRHGLYAGLIRSNPGWLKVHKGDELPHNRLQSMRKSYSTSPHHGVRLI